VSAFDDLTSIPPQQLLDGYLVRGVHGEQVTLSVVEIEPDAALPEHQHVNEQLGMVIAGSLHFWIGDEERHVGPGETWTIPSDTPHSARGGPEGAVVVEVFAPSRSDWKALPTLEPQRPRWPL
jgi:quercetin dioxygenase-like cupin family protein